MSLTLPKYNGKDNLVMLVIMPVFAIAINSLVFGERYFSSLKIFFTATLIAAVAGCIEFILCGKVAVIFKNRFPRTGLIEQYKKSVTETEANMKKADANMKSIFEPILATLKQQLKDAQDPNNEMLKNYKSTYPEMLKSLEATNQQRLAEWEIEYPANHLLFVKTRLEQFLDETANIDFNAQLTEKNGKKYFVNPTYEHKGNRWKLAFRAGKEVIETARAFVKSWINEIK